VAGRKIRAAAAGAVLVAALLVGAGRAGPAAADDCAPAGQQLRPEPWAQRMLDPDRVAPLATGAGVRVAVLDSGVDGAVPQLAGHVDAGTRVTGGTGRGDTDCAGHGTQVAGIIAAQRSTGTGFHGVAPGARIVPVQLADQLPGPTATVDPQVLARAVNAAVDQGADVIAVPVVSYQDGAALRSAVARALSRGAVVVAAAGDGAGDGDPTPYPAAYDGVVGVGAIGPDGAPTSGSQHGGYLDLVAPGAGIVTTQRAAGLTTVDGTAFAAAFVGAIAALVRQAYPNLTPADVGRRLEATASPAPGGPDDDRYGHGIVDPYRAVTDVLDTGSPAPRAGVRPPGRPAPSARSRTGALVLRLGAGGAGLALAVVLVATALPGGRRRRWRPVSAAPPVDRPEADLPPPPVELVDDLPR
jgi:type VII secretion-associated serine protease mycosin